MHSNRRRGRRPRLRLAFGWALAEAIAWPIMPDAILFPLAVAEPVDWWRLTLVGIAGSSLGGALSLAAARTGLDWLVPTRTWLVQPGMVSQAETWLSDAGAGGVRRQPLSGVPFKVFAQVAGRQRLPPVPFLAWAALSRGARFGVVCGIGSLAGQRCAPSIRTHPRLLLGVWTLLFAAGLWRTVVVWQDR